MKLKFPDREKWDEGAELHIPGCMCGDDDRPPCPHAKNPNKTDGTTYWEVPRLIVAYNEGGYNSTEVCLDCANDIASNPTPYIKPEKK